MGSSPALSLQVATTPAAWAQVVAIRLNVFVYEQRVPLEEEVDEHDPEALHVLAFLEGQAAGTGRFYAEGERAVIGRMAVLPWARGRGVGRAILAELMDQALAGL